MQPYQEATVANLTNLPPIKMQQDYAANKNEIGIHLPQGNND